MFFAICELDELLTDGLVDLDDPFATGGARVEVVEVGNDLINLMRPSNRPFVQFCHVNISLLSRTHKTLIYTTLTFRTGSISQINLINNHTKRFVNSILVK